MFSFILDHYGNLITVCLCLILVISLLKIGKWMKANENKRFCRHCGHDVPAYYYNEETQLCHFCQNRERAQA
jgi:hypothetical protein